MKYLSIVLLFIIACSGPTANVVLNTTSADISSTTLSIDLNKTEAARHDFTEKLRLTGRGTNKRALYEEYVDTIGANGILDGINEVYAGCHGQAHDAGKVIYAKVKDISSALRICGDACYTGCMHGVLMEAFKDAQDLQDEEGHVELEKLTSLIKEICLNNTEMNKSYGPGECSQGIGHAIMFLSDYNITAALDACKHFDNQKLEYYCADGAYMEYVVQNDITENQGKSQFYPCDTFPYPAACMRTKVGLVGNRFYSEKKTLPDLLLACHTLRTDALRIGCFHGIGTAHSKLVSQRKLDIRDLCLHGTIDEETACIEGAVEFMGKYFPTTTDRVCDEIEGNLHEICLSAARHKLYSIDKDLSMYLK